MNDFIVSVNGKKKIVKFINSETVGINGKVFACELLHLSGNTYILRLENKFYEISAEKAENGKLLISLEGKRFDSVIRSALQEKASQVLQNSGKIKNKIDIKAPMPGMILKVNRKNGENIVKGETVLILEAMKMENELRAPCQGTIREMSVQEGTPVEKGRILFSIE